MKSILLLTLLSLTSCGLNQPRTAKNKQIIADFEQKHQLILVPKITSFHFQGWQSLDNDHLIISTLRGQSYLLSLHSYCYDLKYSNQIFIKRRVSSVLDTNFDSIIVPNDPGAYCYIDKIQSINAKQIDELSALVKHTP